MLNKSNFNINYRSKHNFNNTILLHIIRPQDPMIVSSLMDGKKPNEVIHPSNSSVRFDLYRWSDNQCPVDYFVISYKKESVSIFQNMNIFDLKIDLGKTFQSWNSNLIFKTYSS